jgi:DNA-binding response OmpR family regulator
MPKVMLIIDDNEDISSLLKSFFQSRDFTVHTAYDGAAGIEKAVELQPDIITLDFNMPGMNGVEVYDELRKSPRTAGIPIIFFSATLLGIIKRMISENPLVRFIKKPCDPHTLGKCVVELLAQSKPASEQQQSPPDSPPPEASSGGLNWLD